MNTIAIIAIERTHGVSRELLAFTGDYSMSELATHIATMINAGTPILSVVTASVATGERAQFSTETVGVVSHEDVKLMVDLDFDIRSKIFVAFLPYSDQGFNEPMHMVMQRYEDIWETCCISALNRNPSQRGQAQMAQRAFNENLQQYANGLITLYEFLR